jgi:transcriptional regulator with XRE-family HTH domain
MSVPVTKMTKIGLLIQKLRIEKGWTQKEVAENIGVSEKAVGKWEQGKGDPDKELLLPIARLFGITAEELLEGQLRKVENGFSMSVLERVAIGGIPAVDQALSKGINLLGVDEYQNTIFDYIYKHGKIELLKYAIQNGWLKKIDFVVYDYEYVKGFDGRYKQTLLPHFGVLYARPKAEQNITYSMATPTDRNGTRIGPDVRVLSFGNRQSGYQSTFPIPARIKSEVKSYTADVYGMLSLIFMHEDLDLLSKIPFYQFFLETTRISELVSTYLKRKTFSESFINEICKDNDTYLAMIEMAAKEGKTSLVQNLASKFNPEVHYFPKEMLKHLVCLNHPIVNERILERVDPSNYHSFIKDVLLYNKTLYSKLPLGTKMMSASIVSETLDLDSKEMDGALLYLKPENIILSKKTELLNKYFRRVDEATNTVRAFLNDLTNVKPKANGDYVLDSKMVQRFDTLFKSHFKFKPVIREYDGDKILPSNPAALELLKRGIEDVRYLQDIMKENRDKLTIESLMNVIELTYQTSMKCKYSSLYDDAILALAPYLNITQKSIMLSFYNRDNPTLIGQLLKQGAVVLLSNRLPSRVDDVVWTYNRFLEDSEYKSSQDDQRLRDSTDHIKTMQFKQLFLK